MPRHLRNCLFVSSARGILQLILPVLQNLSSAQKLDVDKIVESISYDESLTAQVLRLANSALFRQRGDVSTVREAVIALGLLRTRDLAFAYSLHLIFPNLSPSIRKEAFRRHAFVSAVLSPQLGIAFATANQDQTYLCSLLHDIGILVNSLLFPEDFNDVLEQSIVDKVPLEIVEQQILGFTHSESGRILAEKWGLPVIISEVIKFHHQPNAEEVPRQVTQLVCTADLLCQNLGLGYGYEGGRIASLEQIVENFCQIFPRAKDRSSDEFLSLARGFY